MRGKPKKREGAEKGSVCPYIYTDRLTKQGHYMSQSVMRSKRELCCVISILLFQSRITKLPILAPIAKVSSGNLLHVVTLSIASSK